MGKIIAPIYLYLFENKEQLLKIEAVLKENNVLPRRYFYPSLDTLDYLQSKQVCKYSRDIASRILCLPMYPNLEVNDIQRIIQIIKGGIKE